MKLKDRVALVTGAGSGIGEAHPNASGQAVGFDAGATQWTECSRMRIDAYSWMLDDPDAMTSTAGSQFASGTKTDGPGTAIARRGNAVFSRQLSEVQRHSKEHGRSGNSDQSAARQAGLHAIE